MAITPLGAAALADLLGDQARVRVRNASDPEDGAAVVAVVLARHAADGSVERDVEFGLDLVAGEEAHFDPRPPSSTMPMLIELLLRVRIDAGSPASADGDAGLVDVYLTAESDPGAAAERGFDCGIRRHDGEIEPDEQLVPGFAQLAAFARALR
jgi:hypothetical protein